MSSKLSRTTSYSAEGLALKPMVRVRFLFCLRVPTVKSHFERHDEAKRVRAERK